MALITCDFFSDALGMMSKMNVILPQPAQKRIGMGADTKKLDKYPVLFLLHGLSDDETVWCRRTSIERYAAEYNIAVVMPTTGRGWYTDAVAGFNYYTHVAEEVPAIARHFFPLSEKREENFIAGLSMGGYGAFKIATRNPQMYAAAASLSGALDIGQRMADVLDKSVTAELERIFGPLGDIKGSENDLFHTTLQMANSDCSNLKLYQCCGTEDFLYDMNGRYRKFVEPLGLDYTYEEGSGVHSWDYWDMMIQRVLKWLPLQK